MRAKLLIFVFIINGFWAVTSSSSCTKYGDPPAMLTDNVDCLLVALNICNNITGNTQILNFTDSNGQQRYACFLLTASSKPLPLLVWLHPSLFPPSSVYVTNLVFEANTANLTGTMDGPLGYHLLLPLGRDTTHVYPVPDNQGLGWDNWYRNYNRSDPALNVDVETIDYFIYTVTLNSSYAVDVDISRVFMSGWSNGAAMAIEYALNTPGITAAAVYSAPDPYRDYQDPCDQEPYPPYFTPILILYNQCDIFGICTTGTAFINDLNNRYSNVLTAEAFIIDSLFNEVTTCTPLCDSELNLGLVQHQRWPVILNDDVFFNFFRQYHLS
jgi:hypothetical protein